MLPCYLMLDLETTGGNPVRDRITEIAAVRIEQGQEVARWSTLVHPGGPVPPYIERLTGISDAMLADAPGFDQVAAALLALLEGAVLVAHNVRFDHGFLLHEFARAGIKLKTRTLCTVRLSRLLYPQHRSHGLDAIMQRHGLNTLARHRAMGDVEMVLAWLHQAAAELGRQTLREHAQALLQGSAALPPLLETAVHDIPDGPGVYLFYGDGALPLYIGKSVGMRSRVISHFQAAARQPREMRLAQETRRIEWRETAGELGALLLEARLVKQLQPIHNRQLRRERGLCAWWLEDQPRSRPLVKLVSGADFDPRDFNRLYGVYRSRRAAQAGLRELANTQGLCLQALGLETGQGRCFAHQIGRCKGVCCGQEKPELHRLRLELALLSQKLRAWPYPGPIGLREHDTASGRTEVHVFDQWCHLASVQDDAALAEALAQPASLAFDLDTYRLLLKHLEPPGKKNLTLSTYHPLHRNSSLDPA